MRSQNTCFRQKKQNKWENRVSGPTCQHFSSMFPGLLFLGGTSHGRWNSSRQTPTCRVAPKHRCLWTNWTNLAKTVETVSVQVLKKAVEYKPSLPSLSSSLSSWILSSSLLTLISLRASLSGLACCPGLEPTGFPGLVTNSTLLCQPFTIRDCE